MLQHTEKDLQHHIGTIHVGAYQTYQGAPLIHKSTGHLLSIQEAHTLNRILNSYINCVPQNIIQGHNNRCDKQLEEEIFG